MARVPLEACLNIIPNHFDLCAVATKRARQLVRGAPSQIPIGTHKSTVLSLIEIASGHVDRSILDDADLPFIETPKVRLDDLDPLGEA